MKIRKIKETELRKISEIDMDFYEGYSTPLEVLENWQKTFPDGFFIVEENDNICGYIFVELLDKIKAVPFIHDANITHSQKGKYAYDSGFGVKNCSEKTGETLLQEIIRLAKNKNCRAIVWVTGKKMKHDIYEEHLIERFGFKKKKKIEKWESHPNHFVSDHIVYVKEL